MARIRARLTDLESERQQLQHKMASLEARLVKEIPPASKQPAFENAPVTNASASHAKIALFRQMFAGRPDVFPVRWENRKTGHSGYSPACANEWVKGICGKPKVKCGECPHQKFIPPDERVMEKHLRGDNGRNGDFLPVSIRCFRAIHAGFWRRILTKRLGPRTQMPCWRPAGQRECPQDWSGRDQATEGMFGSSFPRRCRRGWHVNSGPS